VPKPRHVATVEKNFVGGGVGKMGEKEESKKRNAKIKS
jgi:hypothetical protein